MAMPTDLQVVLVLQRHLTCEAACEGSWFISDMN
jgi:hypothetical protein